MLQHRISALMDISKAMAFGKPVMFICDAENKTPAALGNDIKARNRSFWQSFYIPIRS